MNPGKFILVIGPTGSGKSMLMKHAMALYPELCTPFSYTTRARRSDAIENGHYRFLAREEFEDRIAAGEFIEYAEYGGNYYGTMKAEVEAALAEGKVLLKEMEVQGARQVRGLLPPEQLRTVYIDAGSWEELVARVTAREPMDDAQLALRHQRYLDEATFKDEADAVIANPRGDGEAAKAAFAELVGRAIAA
ncbi:MAG TPA: guanylate kinase [Candidatus Paceibacterota bacterium]|nr:guanylate kinase [Candidatus Paceibacterota bacterium]